MFRNLFSRDAEQLLKEEILQAQRELKEARLAQVKAEAVVNWRLAHLKELELQSANLMAKAKTI